MDAKPLSSNWKKLQETLKKKKNVSASASTKTKRSEHEPQNGAVKKRKREEIKKSDRPRLAMKRKRMSERVDNTGKGNEVSDSAIKSSSRRNSTTVTESKNGKVNEGRSPNTELGTYIGMDCEMVGVGPNPDHDSALARVSIVNFHGEQLYDSFVKPKEMVTDWRTPVSGILPKHMVEARSLEQVQKDVSDILQERVLVGHAIRNDLDALLLSHPKRDIRDTSKHPPYRKVAGGGSPRLKSLAAEYLGINIQEGSHSSVEDARATMLLYRRDKKTFETEHAKKFPVRVVAEKKETGEDQKKKKKKKKPRKR